MKKVVVKEWSELKDIWNELISKNPIATPFQSYEFLSLTGKGKPSHKDFFRLLGLWEFNAVLYDDTEPIAIAPLLVKTRHGKSIAYFRGYFTVANQLDMIYATLRYSDFTILMDGIRKCLGNVCFHLDKIYSQSPTSDYLKTYLSSAKIYENECFEITIPETYDDWYNGLHKSVRQNLRTAKNRMATDHVECRTKFYIGTNIDPAIYKEMMYVYADRFLVKNSLRFGPLRYLAKKALYLFILKDRVTRWLNKTDTCYHVIVYMNDKVAAFTSGLIYQDKRIHGSRHAINKEFGKYKPGAVLHSATIAYLAEQNYAGKIDVQKLDLGQGGSGGMAYKAALGANVYYTYSFVG